jgi:hypothetical protein
MVLFMYLYNFWLSRSNARVFSYIANIQNHDANNQMQQNIVEQPLLDQVEEQHSMLLYPSDQSGSSINGNAQENNNVVDQVNLALNLALGPFMGYKQAQNDALQVGFVLTFVGPMLPP